MTRRRVVLVVNPRSAGGATGRRLEELSAAARAAFGEVDLRLTEGPGHATTLAAEVVEAGVDLVVAVGGDGTANEVVNGFFDEDRPRRPETAFALVHAGTGGDLVKTLRVPKGPVEALRAIAGATPRPTDVLFHRLVGHRGEPVRRIGINVTGFGINGEVVAHANRSSKRFGGRATFLWSTIRSMATYTPPPVTLEWQGPDGSGEWQGALQSGFVTNAEFCGGGMWVGRGGSMHDGLADLLILPRMPLHRTITGSPRLFSGTIDRVKEVSRKQISWVHAISETATPVLVDIDGEQPGVLPMEVEVLEKTLLVTTFS